MGNERYTRGKGLFIDGYFSETIIDNETGETYYDGRKSNYKSSMELVNHLNEQDKRIKELEKRIGI